MRRDIDFSFRVHPLTKDLATKTGSSAIRQSLVNLVRSNFGDRGFNVDVYTNIDASLFENLTLLTSNTLRTNIKNTIQNFEPMVELVDVEVYEDGANSIYIKIYYTEINNPETQTLIVEMRRIR